MSTFQSTQHIALHVRLPLQERGAAIGKIDEGRVGVFFFDERHRVVGVGLGKDIEIVGARVVRPRLEELHDLRAALDLVARVPRRGHPLSLA